jgi:hypothetical protein
MTPVTTGTPVSGIIATKEDVEALRESCVFLRSQWVHFTTLFRGSDLKRELLQSIAPIFFSDLHQLLTEHLVLQICRLTDEAQTRGRKNLTVKFLMEHTDWSTAPGTLAIADPDQDRLLMTIAALPAAQRRSFSSPTTRRSTNAMSSRPPQPLSSRRAHTRRSHPRPRKSASCPLLTITPAAFHPRRQMGDPSATPKSP